MPTVRAQRPDGNSFVPRPYAPGNRGLWLKSKCLNREEFIVIGWSEPSGSRSHFGALLLGYYSDDGKLQYAGRAGTGFTETELTRLAGVLRPLGVHRMPLDKPPRETRFGSPLELLRVHWVQPEVVVQVTYLTWTEGGLLGRCRIRGSGRTRWRGRWCAPTPVHKQRHQLSRCSAGSHPN